MTTSRTSLLTVTLRSTPGGSDDKGDYDPDWYLVSVTAENRDPRCGCCGDASLPEPPPSPPPPDLDLSTLLDSYGDKGTPMCDACAFEEEVSMGGVLEMLVEPLKLVAPPEEAQHVLRGRLRWDCFTDYEGITECDVEFEPEALSPAETQNEGATQ